jgi:hypothetical protein
VVEGFIWRLARGGDQSVGHAGEGGGCGSCSELFGLETSILRCEAVLLRSP